jgi:hypothetical protein
MNENKLRDICSNLSKEEKRKLFFRLKVEEWIKEKREVSICKTVQIFSKIIFREIGSGIIVGYVEGNFIKVLVEGFEKTIRYSEEELEKDMYCCCLK